MACRTPSRIITVREMIDEQDGLVVRADVSNHGSVTTVVILRVPAVVAILVEQRFAA